MMTILKKCSNKIIANKKPKKPKILATNRLKITKNISEYSFLYKEYHKNKINANV